jgi:O-antigen ligase
MDNGVMATSSRSLHSSSANAIAQRWLDRGIEALWLLTVVFVPLVFLSPDYAKSEAVIGYLEVPKLALLRVLTGGMAILWLVQWGINGRLPIASLVETKVIARRPWLGVSEIARYVQSDPRRWVILAVIIYLATTVISTVLSGSFTISMWGEVPEQDGYSAYNIAVYVFLFGVLATHLKTRPQIWRFLAAIVVMGVLVGGYAVLQHNGHDFLNLGEETGGRTTAFMGNNIFAAAVLMMTIPITVTAAVLSLLSLPDIRFSNLARVGRWWVQSAALGIWVSAISIQLLGLIFTFSRGPWVGAVASVAMMLGMITLFAGRRAIVRIVLLLGVTLAVVGVVIADPTFEFGSDDLSNETASESADTPELRIGTKDEPSSDDATPPSSANANATDIVDAVSSVSVAVDHTAVDVAGRFGSIRGEVISGFTGGRGTHWRISWRLIRQHPWFAFEELHLRWLRPLIGYGPDLFRYTYLLESPPEGPELYPLEPDHAHNFFIHQTVEQGFLGLFSFLGVFAAVVLFGCYQFLRLRRSLTTAHLVILAGLLAVVIGRFLEMMVGIARVSDLTILWALLGVFAALPALMRPTEEPARPPPPNRRERRRARSQSGHSSEDLDHDWRWVWRLGLVAWLVGGIVMLTWYKAVSYPLAAVKAAEALAHLQTTDLPSTLADLEAAIALAPDVPVYHIWRTSVYSAYRAGYDGPLEKHCSLQNEQPYGTCLGMLAYQSSRIGTEQNPYYYRSRLFLADSADSIGRQDEAEEQYRDASTVGVQR